MEAGLWLAIARLALFFVAFPRIARHVGQLRPPASDVASSGPDQAVAQEISWAIDRAGQCLPFRIVCLPRALAAWKMLRRRGIQSKVHFGALRNPDSNSLRTHAWVDACGIEVTGYPEANRCVEIGHLA